MKARIIFSLAAVLVLVGCAPVSYAPPSVDYFQRAFNHHNNGHFDLAIRDYTEAIRRNQNNAVAYGNRGLAYRMKGEYDLAIRDCTEAIHLDPKQPFFFRDRGIAYAAKGEDDLAIRDFNEAIHLDAKEAIYYNLRESTKARAKEEEWRRAKELKRGAQRKAEIVTATTTPAQVLWRAPRKTRVLSVGVGDFKDTAIPSIDYAETDARDFAFLAKSSGIPEENISHFTNEDAYRNDITDALMKLKVATTERSETAIFYFSGHGAPIVKNAKIIDAALVPYDAREDSLEYTGIRISTLREMLSDTRGNWIVILDACFSGKEGRSLMAKNVKGIAVVPKKFNIVHRAKKKPLVDDSHKRGQFC